MSTLSGAPLLTEGFTSVPGGLTGGGWVITNNSTAGGTTTWFQGTGAFSAQAGAADSYAAANFNAADFGGDINLFLITPSINYVGNVTVSFWTRTTTGDGALGDNLEFLLNPTGTTSIAGFSSSLFTSTPSAYPDDWTLVTANATLTGPSRFAFRYNLLNTAGNGNFIGIDTFAVNSIEAGVPEPGTYVISSLGLLALAVLRRRGV